MPSSQGYSMSLVDFSDEVSGWSATTELITAVSLPQVLTLLTNLETALAPLVLGTIIKKQQTVFENTFARTLPTDPNAQRERKLLVLYHDNTTGKAFRVTIPCAKYTGYLVAGTDLYDLANTDVAAFVTAFQNAFRSPDDSTHGITVDKIVAVGRNL